MSRRPFISTNAYLMSQWDWERNNADGLDPNKLTEGSKKKIHWICSNKSTLQCGPECIHRWTTAACDRTRRGDPRECPYSGCCIVPKRCCLHRSMGGIRPDLVPLWVSVIGNPLNKDGELITPWNTLPMSNLSIIWRCPNKSTPDCDELCSHTWITSIANKVSDNHGCPYPGCSNSSPSKCCRHTSLGGVRPDLISEWISVASNSLHKDGELITPFNILPKSAILVNWRCPNKPTIHCDETCSHIWSTPVYNRVQNHNCPWAGCSYGPKQCCVHMSLQWTHPEIVQEWDYQKNGPETSPSMFTYGSNVAIWWKCRRNHSWSAPISSRTIPVGCPHCGNKTEGKLLEWLQTQFDIDQDLVPQMPIMINNNLQRRFDFFIRSLNLYIEVDGPQHFRQVSNWQSNDESRVNDIIKMMYAWERKYCHIIRLNQEDIWYDRIDWKSSLLLVFEHVKTLTVRTVIFYTKEIDLYNQHIRDFIIAMSTRWNITVDGIKLSGTKKYDLVITS